MNAPEGLTNKTFIEGLFGALFGIKKEPQESHGQEKEAQKEVIETTGEEAGPKRGTPSSAP